MNGNAAAPRPRGTVVPTRSGAILLGLTVLVGAAAANTGANLLYLVLALLLATEAYAFGRSRSALREVAIEIDCPMLIEAGLEAAATVRVRGLRARSARLSSGLPLLPGRGLHLPLVDQLVAERVLAFATRPTRRQVVDGLHVRISTRWPFHLLTRARTLRVALRVHIHPPFLPPQAVARTFAGAGADDLTISGGGGSLRDLRPYVPGDNPRRVHWPTSARQGDLVVREDYHQGSAGLVLLIDTTAAAGDEFEAALSRAASAARDALLGGHALELRTPDLTLHLVGRGDLRRALCLLAAIRPGSPARLGWDRLAPGRAALRIEARLAAGAGGASPGPAVAAAL